MTDDPNITDEVRQVMASVEPHVRQLVGAVLEIEKNHMHVNSLGQGLTKDLERAVREAARAGGAQ